MDDAVRADATRQAPAQAGAPDAQAQSDPAGSDRPADDRSADERPPSAPSAAAPPAAALPPEPVLDSVLGSVLDHDGPWSEDDYRTLTGKSIARGDGRAELVDGVLLVGPGPTGPSEQAIAHARDALATALPAGLRVLGAVPVRMGLDCVLVPDLVVTREPAPATVADPAANPIVAADDVLMVVEIVGPEHGALDRSFKPQIYARSGVPYLLLVDHHASSAAANMIIGGRYHEYARASGATELHLEEPFRLRLSARLDPPSG